MFTGIQILEPEIFRYIPPGIFSHSTTDVYPQAMAKGERIAVHIATGKWYELSTISRYLDVSLNLLKDSSESITAGIRCVVSAGAEVQDAILWDNVVIEPGAHVNRAVIGDDVRIRQGEIIKNAAVVRASLVLGKTPPVKALKGELRGDNFVVSLTQ